MTQRFGGYEVVFAGDPATAEMICDLLIAEGIDADVRDAGMGGLIPSMTADGGVGAVKVVVLPEHADRAREILENTAEFRAETTNPGDPDAPAEIEAQESYEGSGLPARRRGRAHTVAWIWLAWFFVPFLIIVFVGGLLTIAGLLDAF